MGEGPTAIGFESRGWSLMALRSRIFCRRRPTTQVQIREGVRR
jgi:hypothetical protein